MTAKAEEGIPALQTAWGAEGSNGFRGYAATVDSEWWILTKKKAQKASKAQEVVR